jgi:hypothetical protein
MPDPKRLVIDASVARAAGGRENPTSQRCSTFLLVISDETPHLLVMTPEIYAEWKNHQAIFASTWRSSMIARKRVAFFKQDDVFNADLREKIDRLNVDDANRR